MTDADEIGEISVWEDIDEDAAMQAAIALYGPRAVTAAAYCALTAMFDDRNRDYGFWFSIFLRLGGGDEDVEETTRH